MRTSWTGTEIGASISEKTSALAPTTTQFLVYDFDGTAWPRWPEDGPGTKARYWRFPEDGGRGGRSDNTASYI